MTIENNETELPQHLLDLLEKLPDVLDRQRGAEVISQHLFPTTKGTIKDWPLPWSCPNGRAVAPTEAYLRFAWAKVSKAHTTTGRWRHLRTRGADVANSEKTAA
jgi:hypothetical protein